jgi:hypothetical protein
MKELHLNLDQNKFFYLFFHWTKMENEFHFEDVYNTPDPIMKYKPYKSSKKPIIIDNGSYYNRSSWSGEKIPKRKIF